MIFGMNVISSSLLLGILFLLIISSKWHLGMELEEEKRKKKIKMGDGESESWSLGVPVYNPSTLEV